MALDYKAPAVKYSANCESYRGLGKVLYHSRCLFLFPPSTVPKAQLLFLGCAEPLVPSGHAAGIIRGSAVDLGGKVKMIC